jgi:hypothetical protein
VPESYFYAKFSISPGSNLLVLHTRTFGGNYTYFKFSAVQNDGTVTHLQPSSVAVNGDDASAEADGLWKFKHDAGENALVDYAKFEYDLSQFDGEDVTLVLGIYNVVGNSGENKLSIRQIEIK